MNIVIFESDDKIDIHDNTIKFELYKKPVAYPVSEIDKITLMMNNIMDKKYDMAVTIKIGENIFIVTSDYENFDEVLFTTIGTNIPLNIMKLTEAVSYTENGEFVIYQR